MKKAAIYCRLSEEDKNKLCATDDSGSIQNQKAMLVQYAEEQGWEVYQIYSDDDYTGADRRRPQFKRLLKDAEQHKFDIILGSVRSHRNQQWKAHGFGTGGKVYPRSVSHLGYPFCQHCR